MGFFSKQLLLSIVVTMTVASIVSFITSSQFVQAPSTQTTPTQTGLSSPDFDSGWVNINGKNGLYFNITHNLGSNDVIVYITGKTRLETGLIQKYVGLSYIPGWERIIKLGIDSSSLIKTVDGDYAIIGNSQNSIYLFETDTEGVIKWIRTLWVAEWGKAYASEFTQANDKGYVVIGGATYPDPKTFKPIIIKTDENGRISWWKLLPIDAGASANLRVRTIVRTSDGGYVVAGTILAEPTQIFLIKLDANGNRQWQKNFVGRGYAGAASVIQARDGGFVLTGSTSSAGESSDVLLIKTDPAGNLQWQKTFGSSNIDYGYSVIQTKDGGYAIAGVYNMHGEPSLRGDMYLVKTDSSGNLQWHSRFGDETSPEEATSLTQTKDGGYVVVGHATREIIAVRTNSDGYQIWQKKYSNTLLLDYLSVGSHVYARSVIETNDGGCVVLGSLNIEGYFYTYLVKTSQEIGLAWTNSTLNTITLYRGMDDSDWNYVRIQIWRITGPTLTIIPPQTSLRE